MKVWDVDMLLFIFGFRWLGHFNLLFWVDIIGLDTEIFFIFSQEALKRKCVGIWHCKGCGKTVAGGAWVVRYLWFPLLIVDWTSSTLKQYSFGPVQADQVMDCWCLPLHVIDYPCSFILALQLLSQWEVQFGASERCKRHNLYSLAINQPVSSVKLELFDAISLLQFSFE